MKDAFDVLIVGGGIVGLTAALAMAQRHYTVAVLDAGDLTVDDHVPDPRVYALNPASQALFASLNIWQRIDKLQISAYRRMYVWDGINGSHLEFDAQSIAAQNLGFIIEESVLKKALLQQIMQHPAISLFPQCTIEQVQEMAQGIEFSSKHNTWRGRLGMIADGAFSPVREKLAVPLTSWSYEQHALIATVQVEKPHQQTAYQVFHPEGPLAFLPLQQANHCSIVWTLPAEKATQCREIAEEEFNKRLTRTFAAHLGQVKLLGVRKQFALQMRHVQQYTGKHWLLLGDAAHTMHPLAGQGLNVGLADISSWVHYLEASQGILTARKALGAYQRERKYSVWQMILLLEGLKRLFASSATPVTTLRGLGLRFCNDLQPVKRMLIYQASGKKDGVFH